MEIIDLGPVFITEHPVRDGCAQCGGDIDADEEARYSDGEVIGQACCGEDIEKSNKEAMGAWYSTS